MTESRRVELKTSPNPWSCWVAYYPDYSNVFVFSADRMEGENG